MSAAEDRVFGVHRLADEIATDIERYKAEIAAMRRERTVLAHKIANRVEGIQELERTLLELLS